MIFKEVEQNNINMKPFNLEEAKASKPVCTRDGREVRILCFDAEIAHYPIVALVRDLNEATGKTYERPFTYTLDGRLLVNEGEDEKDLMMVTEKKLGWINVYRYSENGYGDVLAKTATVYSTKEVALSHIAKDMSYIGTFPFEWEE